VKDPAVHQEVLEKVTRAGEALGLTLVGTTPSTLVGKKSGNQEIFVLWRQIPQA
jgi:predicted rRNA methylase YqxC with S4 and FtsJ domains